MTVTPWMRCEWCGKVVRLNKPLFGSMHLCLTEEGRALKARSEQILQASRQQALAEKRRGRRL